MFSNSSSVNDEFWEVAMTDLHHEPRWERASTDANNDCDDDDDSVELPAKPISYRLDCPGAPQPLHLQLRPLPPLDGIWGPLGGMAWYGSALLAALLFTDDRAQSRLHQFLVTLSKDKEEEVEEWTMVDLGSGAVGLTGIALGWMLRHFPEFHQEQRPSNKTPPPMRIVLTDNDSKCLRQLRANLVTCRSVLECQPNWRDYNLHLDVERLDWLQIHEHLLDDEKDRPFLLNRPIQLVIGSELVYNYETANGCRQVVQTILERNPRALVVIVQVASRDGWSNVFVPGLRGCAHLQVTEESLADRQLHDAAARLVSFGGTTSRDDYSVCYISRKTSVRP